MEAKAFREWLIAQRMYSKEKLVADCVSRCLRVERAFQEIQPDFSFQHEYEKDSGVSFCKLISRRGIAITVPVKLPLGTNHMDSITASVKKYFVYLSAKA